MDEGHAPSPAIPGVIELARQSREYEKIIHYYQLIIIPQHCVPTSILFQMAQQPSAIALWPRNVSLYRKKEVGWAVQAVSSTADFVIVFCFFTKLIA
jgi:hypothetical protein